MLPSAGFNKKPRLIFVNQTNQVSLHVFHLNDTLSTLEWRTRAGKLPGFLTGQILKLVSVGLSDGVQPVWAGRTGPEKCGAVA